MSETPEQRAAKFRAKILAFQTGRWVSPRAMIDLLLDEAQRRIELNEKREGR